MLFYGKISIVVLSLYQIHVVIFLSTTTAATAAFLRRPLFVQQLLLLLMYPFVEPFAFNYQVDCTTTKTRLFQLNIVLVAASFRVPQISSYYAVPPPCVA